MKINTFKIVSLFLFLTGQIFAQDTDSENLGFKGQFSSFAHFNQNNELPLWLGGRYIPQVNYTLSLKNNQLFDFEYSANIFGNAALKPFSKANYLGKIKNYRAWIRYSGNQFEIRAGLQKINFGSANILRPLMWFDQIDPRDPLRLTDGVWGILTRYYFLNNANIWLWGLYGNKNTKGWEISPTIKNKPEIGGRFQLPVPKGEMAVSFHHRETNGFENDAIETSFAENRVGFDTRFDMKIGWWLETSLTTNKNETSFLKNQKVVNMGMDYTFGLGNGLYCIYEQLLASYNKKMFSFENNTTFSLLSLSYPIGLFDNLSAMVYYDWSNNNAYNFLNWQKQFDKISLFLMAYWNPEVFQVPTQNNGQNLYGGKGIQIMFVWNH